MNKGIIASIIGGISLGAFVGILVGALLGKRAAREGWQEPDWTALMDRISHLPLPGRSDGGDLESDTVHA